MHTSVVLSLCILYGGAIVAENQTEKCKYPFRRIGDGCYFISRSQSTPDRASALCLRRGAYLATFETLEEAMLMKFELQQMKTGFTFYIGGRNIDRYVPGGDWRWIKHGKMIKMTYKAFGAREPDGNNASPQDCMMFFAVDRYAIHNIYCDNPGWYSNCGYICEK